MLIKPYQEIVGYLHEVKLLEEDNQIKLIFNIHRELKIPADTISIDKLKDFISKRIAIFNCGDGRYAVRKIREK